MGWVRTARIKRMTCEGESVYETPAGNSAKVQEVLGITMRRDRKGRPHFNKTIHAGAGAEIARICGLDPVALGLELRAANRTTAKEAMANMGQRINCAVGECPAAWDNDGPYSAEKAMRDGWVPTTGEPPDQPRVIIEWWWCPEHAPAVAA